MLLPSVPRFSLPLISTKTTPLRLIFHLMVLLSTTNLQVEETSLTSRVYNTYQLLVLNFFQECFLLKAPYFSLFSWFIPAHFIIGLSITETRIFLIDPNSGSPIPDTCRAEPDRQNYNPRISLLGKSLVPSSNHIFIYFLPFQTHTLSPGAYVDAMLCCLTQVNKTIDQILYTRR